MILPIDLDIVTRAEWHAKAALPGGHVHTVQHITIHHAGVASKPAKSLEDKLRDLQTWSQRADKLDTGKEKPAWIDIPYHYYISIDGRIGEGREAKYAGDTNTEYDPTGHLLIMVEGNFDVEPISERQLDALKTLTILCAKQYGITADQIQSHKDYSKQTSCPGTALYRHLYWLRSEVRQALRVPYRPFSSR